MAVFLSDTWLSEMQVAAGATPLLDHAGRVALRQQITGHPEGDVSWVLVIDEGKLQVDLDPAAESDVTFTQDTATATALHRGEMTTHEAFFAGRVKVTGRLDALLEHSDLLQGTGVAFAEVRQRTTYPEIGHGAISGTQTLERHRAPANGDQPHS